METKILEFLKDKKGVYLDTIKKNCTEEKDGEFDLAIKKLKEKGRIPQQNTIYLLVRIRDIYFLVFYAS